MIYTVGLWVVIGCAMVAGKNAYKERNKAENPTLINKHPNIP